jgi:hypothetical protein
MRIPRKPPPSAAQLVIEFAFALLFSLFLLSQGFRLISVPFLLAWACAYGTRWGRTRSEGRMLRIWFAFLATIFVPLDVDVGGFYDRRGTSPGGIHFVRTVPGIPMHTLLIQKYGEYISTGCVAGAFEPGWVLVWN